MMIVNEKLRTFKIEVDDIENVDFEHGMIQEIAKAYADAMDLRRYELVLNKNIITIKDKITGINSYMGMKVSLEPLEKDISFIVRPSNQPTYEELQQENAQLKDKIKKGLEELNKTDYEYSSRTEYANIIMNTKEILKEN
jgi:hypothetical protein